MRIYLRAWTGSRKGSKPSASLSSSKVELLNECSSALELIESKTEWLLPLSGELILYGNRFLAFIFMSLRVIKLL